MSAFAQSAYPNRPLRFVVPFVDNRLGADAIIGTEAAAKSAPHGYTLYLTTDWPTTMILTAPASLQRSPKAALAPKR